MRQATILSLIGGKAMSMVSKYVSLNPCATIQVRSSGVKSVPALEDFPSENHAEHDPKTSNIFPINTALSIFCPLITPYEMKH